MVPALLLVALIIVLALSLGMVARLRRYQQTLQQLEARLDELQGLVEGSPETPRREPEPYLAVRLTDPLEVARRESRSARLLARHLPTLVSRKVYEQVMDEIGRGLQEREIEADLEVSYR